MNLIYEGVTYNVITERRRYGNTTYTWVHGFEGPNGICYGPKNGGTDPFPCVIPAKKELIPLLIKWKESGEKWEYEGFNVIYL